MKRGTEREVNGACTGKKITFIENTGFHKKFGIKK